MHLHFGKFHDILRFTADYSFIIKYRAYFCVFCFAVILGPYCLLRGYMPDYFLAESSDFLEFPLVVGSFMVTTKQGTALDQEIVQIKQMWYQVLISEVYKCCYADFVL